MRNICPCCHRRIPAPRKNAQSKIDKRLEQDIARANAAIAALANAESKSRLRDEPTPSAEAVASFRLAVESESKRMTRALTDHRLLWSIYRRTNKTTTYYESQPVAEPTPEPVRVATPEPELVAA